MPFDPLRGGTTASIPLAMYQGENATAYLDANGGLYSNITPVQFRAWGGAPQSGYTWSVTSLPFLGLVIDPLTGLVHGTVPAGTLSGRYSFSVTVSDGSTTYTSGSGGAMQAFVTVSPCSSNTGGRTNPLLCHVHGHRLRFRGPHRPRPERLPGDLHDRHPLTRARMEAS